MKRRHHYVWQNYLKAWSVQGQIWCRRDGKVFQSNTINVGQQRDFYRLKDLTPEEISFIKAIALKGPKSPLQSANERWIDTFQLVFKAKSMLVDFGISDVDAETALDPLINDLEEDLHAKIELDSIKYLERIIEGDIDFFLETEGRMAFSHFLCLQYMRTRRIQESFCGSFRKMPQLQQVRIENCWSVMRHIFATKMAFSLISDGGKYKMTLIENETDLPFICGDQPVVNTYAAGKLGKSIVSDTELYYPVSPDRAILISSKDEYKGKYAHKLNAHQVAHYNSAIIEMSLEQIYSNQKAMLE